MSDSLTKLSSSQRAAIEQKRLSGSFTASALLDEVRALANFDELNEAARRGVKRLMIASIVAFVVTIWIALAAVSELLPFALALLVSAVYFGFRMRKHSQFDVSDNVGKVALPFLAILKQDIAPDELLQIELDLSLPTDKSKRLGESAPYPRGAYHKVIDTNYRDAWFEGTARLADGAIVRWNILDEICESKRSKTNARGKRKTKTRYAKRCQIDIAVALPSLTYHLDPGSIPPMPGQKVTLERGEKRSTIKLTRKLKAKSLEPIEPRILIDAVSAVYRCAVPRQGSAA